MVEDRPINIRKILSSAPSLPLLAKTKPPCSAIFLRQLRYLLFLLTSVKKQALCLLVSLYEWARSTIRYFDLA